MTLEETKKLLSSHNIPFQPMTFQNEEEYWRHIALYTCVKNAKNSKVLALEIPSANGKKNIELQCNDTDGVFRFVDMRFGDYCCELFDCTESELTDCLIDEIQSVMSGRIVIISANDLKRKSWLGDACFDYEDAGFQKAIGKIEKKKRFFAAVLCSKNQYEIFDWNTYRKVIK